MCTPYERKEANRLYWMVKGMLIPDCWSDKEVVGIYHSYFKRLWGNNEAYLYEEGFEDAFRERNELEIEKVAILGYN